MQLCLPRVTEVGFVLQSKSVDSEQLLGSQTELRAPTFVFGNGSDDREASEGLIDKCLTMLLSRAAAEKTD